MTKATKYISKAGEEGIKRFTYKGGSDSILYTHLWSPLCNWIVQNYIPKWMAPNLITTIGFILHVTTHLMVMYYSPNLQQEIPGWLCISISISLLSYQILDNCDGKQARATGSSSPLGMLFDHGCDAVATWMVTLNTIAILQVTDTRLQYYGTMMIGLVTFYQGMWSQYHVGVFRLGYINAVDEGLVVAELIYLASGIFTQSIWKINLGFLGINTGELVLYTTMLLAVLQTIQFIYDLWSSSSLKTCITAMKHQACTALLIVTFISIDINLGMEFVSNNFVLVIYSLAFVWSKMITHIQIAHLTEEKFHQWKTTLLVVCISLITASIASSMNIISTDTVKLILFIDLFIAIVSYVHLIYSVFNQIARVLKINVFKLGKRVEFEPASSNESTGQEDDDDSI